MAKWKITELIEYEEFDADENSANEELANLQIRHPDHIFELKKLDETCEECDRIINKGEETFLHGDLIVCGKCHERMMEKSD